MINLLNKKPRTPIIAVRKLIGKKTTMSFSEDKTHELWKSFMSGKNEIKNNIGSELYSMKFYGPGFFDDFNPDRRFEKIAAIQVSDFDYVPDGMESLILSPGLYAVFQYKGKVSEASDTFKYIYYEWLPGSGYVLDNRPHFEILGEKYGNDDDNSEEEIWIPIKRKN